MLETTIDHIMSDEAFQRTLDSNENVMICCGRNGPMCLPVYDAMENLEEKWDNVSFKVIPYDAPVSHNIKNLPEVRGFMGLPFTVYFKNGKVVYAAGSIQTKAQIVQVIANEFKKAA